MKSALLLCLGMVCASTIFAHGGGLDANGCHTNRKTGDYHCHRAPSNSPPISNHSSSGKSSFSNQASSRTEKRSFAASSLPPGCHVGPRGGTYTITKSGRKNYGGC
jgi:hypothetical protein